MSIHLVEGDGDGASHLEETAWHEAGATDRDMATVLWAGQKCHLQVSSWAGRGLTVGSKPARGPCRCTSRWSEAGAPRSGP